MPRVTAYVTYEVVAEFDDDGSMCLRDLAHDAVKMEAPSGEIVDVEIESIEA